MSPSAATEHQAAQHVGRTLAIALAFLLTLLAATLYVAWPTSVITSSKARAAGVTLETYLPQGWAFFTRSPEASDLVPYDVSSSGSFTRSDTLPQTLPRNLFGLSRNQRAQSTELALIADSLDTKEWKKCNDYLSRCLDASKSVTPVTLRNKNPNAFFCGTMTLAIQTPVKWAYRNDTSETSRVSKFAVVDLKC